MMCCSKEPQLFLREMTPSTITGMAKFADQFAESRVTTLSSLTQKNVASEKKSPHERQVKEKDRFLQKERVTLVENMDIKPSIVTTTKERMIFLW